MAVYIDNKSSIKQNLTFPLPFVRSKLLITVCLETRCIAKLYEISKLISVSILFGNLPKDVIAYVKVYHR